MPTPAPAADSGNPASAVSVRAIMRLALPSSAVFLMATLMSLVMIRFAAALGPDAVAAVNAGTRIYNVFIALCAGISAGTLALVANAWGAGQREEAARLLELSLLLALALGALLSLLSAAGIPALIGAFGLDAGAGEEAASYGRWLAMFFAPMAFCLILTAGLRAAGDVRTPMFFALLINAGWLLIAWRWSIAPPFGMEPHVRWIALGMGLGHVPGAIAAFILWKRNRLVLGPAASDAHDGRRLRALLYTGYPSALEQALLQFGVVAFIGITGRYGTAAFAAYGTGISLLSLAMVVGVGFSMAVSVLVGQQLGAGSPANARLAALRALKLCTVVLGVPGILLALNAGPVALWLTGDAEIARLTVVAIYAFTAVLPMLAVEFCIGGALRGAGDTRFPLLNVLAGLLVVRFGLAWLLSRAGFSIEWIYATLVADYAVKSTLLLWRFRSGRWMQSRLRKK